MTDRLSIDALEDLATEFRQVAARRPAGWRTAQLRRPGLLGIAAAVVIAGSAGAALVLTAGDPIPPAPVGDFTADQQPLATTARVSGVQTADPVGGAPWGLRLYRNAAGQQCYIPGRLVNGRIGVIRSGIFHALPLRGPGTCANALGQFGYSMFARQSHMPGEDPRTVIFGSTTSKVVRITFDNGVMTKTVIPGADGAYLAVFDGFQTVKRTLHFADGTQQVLMPRGATPSP